MFGLTRRLISLNGSPKTNLAMLSSAVGIELELIETESSVGSFNPQKPSKDHWTTLRCGTSAYHIALLIDTHRGRIGIEFYVPDDKEIGRKAIGSAGLFEERLGLAAAPFDAKKASGLRFYKDGCKIKDNETAWPGFISEQLKWAIAMKKVIAELGL